MANAACRPDDFRHLALGDVGSTNTECMKQAQAGDPGLLWITADRQTGGRGRRGRTWISEPGNLYASLLLIDPAPAAHLASLPLVVALALYRAIRAELPWAGDRLSIKWPNDVLFDGKKVSGILIEAEKLPDGRQAVVIGCGVNVAHRPENPLYPAASLNDEGGSTSAPSLFARLLVEMAEALTCWDKGLGTSAIVAAWKAHVRGLGESITVNLPDRSLSGIFSAVDDDGVLMLRLASGETIRVASGDVFFSNN